MKRNTYSLQLVVILLTINALNLTAQNPKYSAEIEGRISKVEKSLIGWVQTQDQTTWTLAERMTLYNVKGLAIAVVHNYKIEWVRGYGWADESEKRPVNEKTLFQAASISKSLNGIGVLKLVQDKKLDLNADINNYLTSWKFPYDEKSKGEKITTMELLSHTAGINIDGFPGYAAGEELPSLFQILEGQKPANTKAIRSMNEPGTNFVYSGGGVIVSQMIVMDITHKPYEEYMQKNVLNPLGMKSSFFNQPPLKKKKNLLATGYKASGEEVSGKYHIYPEQAAAGLWTNPVDLSRYIIETQLSYQGKSSKVLTPEMTKLRITPVFKDAALGVFVNTNGSPKYFMHQGGNKGFSCQYVGSFAGGEGMAVMTNSDNGAILDEIVNSVASVYNWKDYYKPVIKKVIELPENLLDKYIGKYDLEGTQVNLARRNKELTISFSSGIFWKVQFTSNVDFFIREYRVDLRFVSDQQGNVTGFTIDGTMVKKIE